MAAPALVQCGALSCADIRSRLALAAFFCKRLLYSQRGLFQLAHIPGLLAVARYVILQTFIGAARLSKLILVYVLMGTVWCSCRDLPEQATFIPPQLSACQFHCHAGSTLQRAALACSSVSDL